MDCPACRNAMITLEFNEVEVDHCLECKGIWLDSGELEILLESSKQAREVLESFKSAPKVNEKPRKCPICSKKMLKVTVGGQKTTKKVLIDACRNNDGLWFDKGELGDILEMSGFDSQNRIQKLLKDVFGADGDTQASKTHS